MLRTLIALESNTPSVITLKPNTVHQLVENIYNFKISFLSDHAVGEVRFSVALIDPKAATSNTAPKLQPTAYSGRHFGIMTFVSTAKWRPDAEGALCGSFFFL